MINAAVLMLNAILIGVGAVGWVRHHQAAKDTAPAAPDPQILAELQQLRDEIAATRTTAGQTDSERTQEVA